MVDQIRAVAEPQSGAGPEAGPEPGKDPARAGSHPVSGPKSLLVLAVACFALYFTGLGDFPAIDPAEGGVAGYGVFHPVHVWAPARAIALWGIQ